MRNDPIIWPWFMSRRSSAGLSLCAFHSIDGQLLPSTHGTFHRSMSTSGKFELKLLFWQFNFESIQKLLKLASFGLQLKPTEILSPNLTEVH